MAWEKWIKRATLTLKISPHPEQPDSIVDLSIGLLRIRVKQLSSSWLQPFYLSKMFIFLYQSFHNPIQSIRIHFNFPKGNAKSWLLLLFMKWFVSELHISWISHIFAKLWELNAASLLYVYWQVFSMASFCIRKHRKKLIPVHESLNRNSFIRTETTRRN